MPRKKKSSRYHGGKLLYRSIEKPINVYSRAMDVVDVTDPEYKRDLKKLKKLQKLLAIQKTQDEIAGAKKHY